VTGILPDACDFPGDFQVSRADHCGRNATVRRTPFSPLAPLHGNVLETGYGAGVAFAGVASGEANDVPSPDAMVFRVSTSGALM